MTPLLLDTCAVIWLVNGERLSTEAQAALLAAYDSNVETFVSPITAWEIGLLVAGGRLRPPIAPLAWYQQSLELPGVSQSVLTPAILMSSCFLPGKPPRDPADRIIAATARELGHRVVTRDRKLLGYADEGFLHALAC